jgi:hypothetical protein
MPAGTLRLCGHAGGRSTDLDPVPGLVCTAVFTFCRQGSLLPGRYGQVSTGQELLDQLANGTARFIRVTGNVKVPAGLPAGRVAVNRCARLQLLRAPPQTQHLLVSGPSLLPPCF